MKKNKNKNMRADQKGSDTSPRRVSAEASIKDIAQTNEEKAQQMNNSQQTYDVSVVICTYNRCDTLEKTLESFFEQIFKNNFSYELIVVDNNSTDQTKDIVEKFINKYENVFYHFEPEQGLNLARNRGLYASKAEIVIYSDDDVLIDKDWLSQMWVTFEQYHCDTVGGRVLPIYPPKTPNWVKEYKDLISGPVVMYDGGEEVKSYELLNMCPFIGANMGFRKQVLIDLGAFRSDLGVGKGTMGDDTEIFIRFSRAKKNVYYCGKAVVLHPVERSRMTFRYLAKWYLATGSYAAIRDKEEAGEMVNLFGIPRYLYKGIVIDFLKLIFQVFNRRCLINNWRSFFRKIGMMKAYRSMTK